MARVVRLTDHLNRSITISPEQFAARKYDVGSFVMHETETVEVAVVPDCGYFPVFTTPEGSVSPEEALNGFLDGEAELLTDPQTAAENVQAFARDALLH